MNLFCADICVWSLLSPYLILRHCIIAFMSVFTFICNYDHVMYAWLITCVLLTGSSHDMGNMGTGTSSLFAAWFWLPRVSVYTIVQLCVWVCTPLCSRMSECVHYWVCCTHYPTCSVVLCGLLTNDTTIWFTIAGMQSLDWVNTTTGRTPFCHLRHQPHENLFLFLILLKDINS